MAKTENKEVDWIEIQRNFDAISNVDEIFYYLRDLVFKLKICNNTECKIFPELHHLDIVRMQFDEFKSLKEATSQIKDQSKLEKIKKDFQNYIIKSKETFSKIFAMKSSQDTSDLKHKQYHEEYLETLRIINENNYPMPIQVEGAVQAKMDEITSGAIGLDQRLEEKRKEFEKFIKTQKEAKKMKKSEKSEKEKPNSESEN